MTYGSWSHVAKIFWFEASFQFHKNQQLIKNENCKKSFYIYGIKDNAIIWGREEQDE